MEPLHFFLFFIREQSMLLALKRVPIIGGFLAALTHGKELNDWCVLWRALPALPCSSPRPDDPSGRGCGAYAPRAHLDGASSPSGAPPPGSLSKRLQQLTPWTWVSALWGLIPHAPGSLLRCAICSHLISSPRDKCFSFSVKLPFRDADWFETDAHFRFLFCFCFCF